MCEEIFPGRSMMNKRNNNGPIERSPGRLQIELHIDHHECYLIQLPDVY